MLGVAALLTTLSACASGEGPLSLVEIAPAAPDVEPGATIQFAVHVAGTADPSAEWTVMEPQGGTIDAAGTYTAPEAEGTYTVLASVKSIAAAQSTPVRVKRNLRVDVSPSSATLAVGESLALAASVNAADKGVTWSVAEGAEGGTVTEGGLYTAPQAPGTYTVVATSTADPSRSGAATMTVTAPNPPPPPPPTVAIAITPQSASLVAGSTVQFAATVTGTADVRVTWSVAEVAGGTVSATGLYTAPGTAGTYHVIATSSADRTKTATAPITVTTGSAPAPVDPTLWTVQRWESLFLPVMEAEHTARWLSYSTSGNSWRYYALGHGIDGLTAMFAATGNPKYLDRALFYVRNMIASAVRSSSLPNSQYKDGYLGWGAWDHDTDPSINGGEYELYEAYSFRYVTKLLRVMRRTPAIYADPAYRQTYEQALAFVKTNVFDKWRSRGTIRVYSGHAHIAAHWALISLELWDMTDDPVERAKYRTVVDNVNLHMPNFPSSLRQQMRLVNGAYFWHPVWGSYATPGQDVSHGNSVIAYIVEAHDRGIEWTDADLRAFVGTFLKIWVPTSTGYRYAAYVDGSGTGRGWYDDGFCKLGRYDAALQKRLEQHTFSKTMQFYGNGALNAKTLNGR